jgi:hypothetical protein
MRFEVLTVVEMLVLGIEVLVYCLLIHQFFSDKILDIASVGNLNLRKLSLEFSLITYISHKTHTKALDALMLTYPCSAQGRISPFPIITAAD